MQGRVTTHHSDWQLLDKPGRPFPVIASESPSAAIYSVLTPTPLQSVNNTKALFSNDLRSDFLSSSDRASPRGSDAAITFPKQLNTQQLATSSSSSLAVRCGQLFAKMNRIPGMPVPPNPRHPHNQRFSFPHFVSVRAFSWLKKKTAESRTRNSTKNTKEKSRLCVSHFFDHWDTGSTGAGTCALGAHREGGPEGRDRPG